MYFLLKYLSFFCSNKDELTQDKIQTAKVLVFGGPRKKFTAMEVIAIHTCINTIIFLVVD